MSQQRRELIWILICIACLALLPWWQSVLCAAAGAPVLLRMTERGFRRRIVLLFISLSIVFIGYHVKNLRTADALAQTFRLPHHSLLALMSAGCFALVLSLAGEAALSIFSSLKGTTKDATEQFKKH